jgi:thiaminase/transcriptional activator TenA
LTIATTERFSKRLFRNVGPIWSKIHDHPFVKELGRGDLPNETFTYYMKQDYVFLIDYAKLFAIGSIKSNNLDVMTKFSKLFYETLNFEMDLHREYAGDFGISKLELEQTKPTPYNLAYTRYMLNVGQNGSLVELVSCLLPCMWSYWEIGKALKRLCGEEINSNPYKKWINMYASLEFGELTTWLIDLLDTLTAGKPENELEVLEDHFLVTARYEFLFWDMVYHQQDWPL